MNPNQETQPGLGPGHVSVPHVQTGPIVIRDHLGKHLNKPTEYDGKDRNACHIFVSQLKLYMVGNNHLFPDEMSKVMFASTYLRGKAFSWIEPKLFKSPTEVPMLADFELFCKEMVRNMGDPDREKNMGKKLNALHQTGSAAQYRTEFDNIAQYLTWDNSALRLRFYDGLKSDVKDAISYVPDEPDDFKDYQDLAIRLDNRIYERKQEGRKSAPKPNPPNTGRTQPKNTTASTTTTTTRAVTGPGPMDLDATRSKKFKPLTPEERQHRISNSLCLYCGKAGHRAGDCPAKSQKPFKLHATLTGGESDLSDSKN